MRHVVLLIAAIVAAPSVGFAQGRFGSATSAPGGSSDPRLQPQQRERPPGLPGLLGRQAPVIPAQTPGSSMNPNDALFDAISRGDVPAARDAVARGAEPTARNALGLTAYDSAVDQGRPEMIFYVLSLRGGSISGSSAVPVEPPRLSGTAPRAAAGRGRDATRASPAAEPSRPAPQRARLWAHDGGAAREEVGFLGFDAGQTGSAPAVSPERDPTPARRRRG
jgi:hypothetical protein